MHKLADCRFEEITLMNNAFQTHDTDRHNSVGLLTGLLFGALAGFETILLLSPQSGRKTRAQIGQESKKMQRRATDTYDDLLTLSRFDDHKILAGGHYG